MKISEGIKKCVAFVTIQMADKSYRLVGTVFFVGRSDMPNKYSYAVTAKHVIEGIKNKGLTEVYIRINLKNKKLGLIKSNLTDWIYHNDINVDIAVVPIVLTNTFEHLLFPMTQIMTESVIKDKEIDVGEEVFVTGLFRHHHGQKTNIPIVRVGNISAMPEEKIQTKKHFMDGYLIEARSIGGLSGSPVFVNLGVMRVLNGQLKTSASGNIYYLMGIIYGHYDTNVNQIDADNSMDLGDVERVNTGIAIVTPIEKLVELFNQENIKKHEASIDKAIDEGNKMKS